MYYYSNSDRKLVGENGDENRGTLEERLGMKSESLQRSRSFGTLQVKGEDLDLTLSDKQNY